MSEREKILARIREALRIRAPFPGTHGHDDQHHDHAPSAPRPAATHAREWLPKVGPTSEERLELFRLQSADLKTSFHVVAGKVELSAKLCSLRDAAGWKRIALHSTPLTSIARDALGLPALDVKPGYSVAELEACDVGITECDALIAQTGSLLITTRSAGGRALSVLPPHHLVIARRNQLLPDLPAAFQLIAEKYGSDYPSFISLVTGPSRTGDIERILVLGAHGPKELTVLLIDDGLI